MESYMNAKKRKSVSEPTFGTLGERMNQGGRQKHSHPHGLAQQMEQGGGYSQTRVTSSLGAVMGQRSK